MTDLLMQAVPHHVAHAAQIKYIHTGVSYMTSFVAAGVSLVVGFILGWYVKGRGWFGVKVDASNVVKASEKAVSEVQSTIHG